MVNKSLRSLNTIAADISADWKKVNFAAAPYLSAMRTLRGINENYGYDSGRSVVRYFLANAGTWRGEKAREIKTELKEMLK